mmetsp:Transcript_118130/g.341565  ORF Transcript_118130/g.341565 Transcript_118130/m.341565 type:complete len:289 (+) Transcript_118130:216-1082(+)
MRSDTQGDVFERQARPLPRAVPLLRAEPQRQGLLHLHLRQGGGLREDEPGDPDRGRQARRLQVLRRRRLPQVRHFGARGSVLRVPGGLRPEGRPLPLQVRRGVDEVRGLCAARHRGGGRGVDRRHAVAALHQRDRFGAWDGVPGAGEDLDAEGRGRRAETVAVEHELDDHPFGRHWHDLALQVPGRADHLGGLRRERVDVLRAVRRLGPLAVGHAPLRDAQDELHPRRLGVRDAERSDVDEGVLLGDRVCRERAYGLRLWRAPAPVLPGDGLQDEDYEGLRRDGHRLA